MSYGDTTTPELTRWNVVAVLNSKQHDWEMTTGVAEDE